MQHLRDDYNHIQDPTGKIGENEPVFLLRAKDSLSPRTVRFWADALANEGGDPLLINSVIEWADKMEEWQSENGSKLPDTPYDQLLKDNTNENG